MRNHYVVGTRGSGYWLGTVFFMLLAWLPVILRAQAEEPLTGGAVPSAVSETAVPSVVETAAPSGLETPAVISSQNPTPVFPGKPPAQNPEGVRPTLILVQGAPGEAVYAEGFSSQIKSWQAAAGKANAEVRTIGEAGSATPGRAFLEKTLTDFPKDGAAEVWIVLIGHGTWDGKEARFNLEGPDLSAGDLAAWLKPVQRPVVVINTSSSSAPFIPVLAGPNRTIITATRSGNERNYARFGQFLAASLDDPAADYDQDGRVSLLEWFLRAGSRTGEFYLAEGRIQTEHALIDDNGDGKGTPVEWFRGLRATTKTKDKTPLDGTRAHQRSLAPDPSSQKMTPEQLTERDKLEAEINALREKKSTLPEEEYYQQLETLFRKLAALYGGT